MQVPLSLKQKQTTTCSDHLSAISKHLVYAKVVSEQHPTDD